MARKYWTSDDDEKLKQLAETFPTAKELSLEFGVTACSIRNRCRILGVHLHNVIPKDLFAQPLALRHWLWENRVKPNLVLSESGCLEWHKACYHHGYGQVRVGDTVLQTHRIAYESYNNVLLGEARALHECDNPKCCNPLHLFAGTQIENVQDMMRKERNGGQFKKGQTPAVDQVRGTRVHNARFVDDDILAMRHRHETEGIGHKRLAKEYGCSFATMRCILRRKTWKHVA